MIRIAGGSECALALFGLGVCPVISPTGLSGVLCPVTQHLIHIKVSHSSLTHAKNVQTSVLRQETCRNLARYQTAQ